MQIRIINVSCHPSLWPTGRLLQTYYVFPMTPSHHGNITRDIKTMLIVRSVTSMTWKTKLRDLWTCASSCGHMRSYCGLVWSRVLLKVKYIYSSKTIIRHSYHNAARLDFFFFHISINMIKITTILIYGLTIMYCPVPRKSWRRPWVCNFVLYIIIYGMELDAFIPS